MCKKKEASKEPVTLEHIDQHLHDMKRRGEWNLVFGGGVTIVAIGIALLIKSRSTADIEAWLWALVIGIGFFVMILVILSQMCCKKSN